MTTNYDRIHVNPADDTARGSSARRTGGPTVLAMWLTCALTPASAPGQAPPPPMAIQNVIPLRFVHTVDSAGDKPHIEYEKLQASVRRTNDVFRAAGIRFWIKSVETVVLPELSWRNDQDLRWDEIRGGLGKVFPTLSNGVYLGSLVKTGQQWADVASALFGDPDEVMIWVMRKKNGIGQSVATFPNKGRTLFIVHDNLYKEDDYGGYATSHLAHELGHFFGLRHAWSNPGTINPQTQWPYPTAARWDLVFRPYPWPQFFSGPSSYNGSVAAIADVADPFAATDELSIPTATILGQTYGLGSSALKGLLFETGQLHAPPHSFAFGINVMDYYSKRKVHKRAPSYFSRSQVAMIRDFVGYDQHFVTDKLDNHLGVRPSGVDPRRFTSLRSELGKAEEDFIWWANGDLSFASETKPIKGTNYDPVAADFDGDGDDDIVWYDPATGKASFWWSQNRSFQYSSGHSLGQGLRLFAGDFDGNGKDDLYLYKPGSGQDVIYWAYGNRQFLPLVRNVSGWYEPFACDIDGDLDDDIFWYRPSDGYAHIWWSLGEVYGGLGTDFVSQNWVTIGDGQPYTPVVGDFEGVHGEDIFWYRPGSGQDRIWMSNLTQYPDKSDGVNVQGEYLPIGGDFDGDGRGDILWDRPGSTSDYLWTGENVWPPFDRSGKTAVHGSFEPVAGDFDGDGDTDIFWYRKS